MLSIIHLIDVDEYMYITQETLEETIEALKVLNIAYEVYITEEKVYRITWYNDIDEDWYEIWCTPEEYEEKLALILEAEVEYNVTEFN
jgi:hypothetical protein